MPRAQAVMDEVGRCFAADMGSADTLEFTDHGLFRPGLSEEEMKRGTLRKVRLGEHLELASVGGLDAALLFCLAEFLRPAQTLEIGTCGGYSTAILARGIGAGRSDGRMATLEGSRELHALARRNLASLGLDWVKTYQGLFEVVLDEALAECGPLDLVFDDGQHTGTDELERFEKYRLRASDRAVVLFDDIGLNEGMRTFWKTIQDDARVTASIDLGRFGACILVKDAPRRGRFSIGEPRRLFRWLEW